MMRLRNDPLLNASGMIDGLPGTSAPSSTDIWTTPTSRGLARRVVGEKQLAHVFVEVDRSRRDEVRALLLRHVPEVAGEGEQREHAPRSVEVEERRTGGVLRIIRRVLSNRHRPAAVDGPTAADGLVWGQAQAPSQSATTITGAKAATAHRGTFAKPPELIRESAPDGLLTHERSEKILPDLGSAPESLRTRERNFTPTQHTRINHEETFHRPAFNFCRLRRGDWYDGHRMRRLRAAAATPAPAARAAAANR